MADAVLFDELAAHGMPDRPAHELAAADIRFVEVTVVSRHLLNGP